MSQEPEADPIVTTEADDDVNVLQPIIEPEVQPEGTNPDGNVLDLTPEGSTGSGTSGGEEGGADGEAGTPGVSGEAGTGGASGENATPVIVVPPA